MAKSAAKTNPNQREAEHRPDPIDIHVGQKLRQRRMLVGLSQEKLGESVGLTFQQIQKYERGTNRMGASRVFHFSRVLAVPVSYFFEDLSAQDEGADSVRGFAEGKQALLQDDDMPDKDLLHRRETLDLIRTFYRIQDPRQRRKILELIKAIATSEAAAGS
jgi:transcriptional regulator with XRE-family HTH domain